MTVRQANRIVAEYNGFNKTDDDFTAMLNALYRRGLWLADGTEEYYEGMTRKIYTFRVAKTRVGKDGEPYGGKSIGTLIAYKCWRTRNPDAPFEILAYIVCPA
jgi:hypothetical protein